VVLKTYKERTWAAATLIWHEVQSLHLPNSRCDGTRRTKDTSPDGAVYAFKRWFTR
jgi:hypothetical protein